MEEKIRFPAVAGQFYPAERNNLEGMIENFLGKVRIPKIEGKIFGMIVPHAGYIFSGFVAAHCYKAIERKDFESVILIGDSHYERFDGVSVWERGEWETPLGRVKVDEKLAEKLLKESERFFIRDSAHLFEHSLEVQLPFLQKTLKDFKILPIIFGSEDKDWKRLSDSISKLMREKKILVIASSDLSHYPPYEEAKKADLEVIEAILTLNPQSLAQKIEELEKKGIPGTNTLACAQDSIKTILEISKNLKAKAKLLKYQNSGDTIFGEKSQVVGYGAIIFVK
jgi:hypothetical protein